MSKELTEQWRNRKLGGRWYYIKILGKIEIARLSKYNQFYHLPITNGYAANKDVSEVIAPVPTYAEFKDLMSNLQHIDKCRELTENVNQFQQVKLGVELTEKYYSGTLPSGHYYFSNGNSVYPVEYRQVEPFLCANGITVLCEVPSYEEYKDFEQDNRCLKSGIETYEKQLSRIFEQLKEANELLFDVLDCRESREYHAEKAEQYFKKYGVEK